MRYCLLMRSLDPLPIKRLARAFAASGIRQTIDAPAAARFAFGILLDDLTATAASRLAAALDLEGIDVEPCAEEDVPALPRARAIRKVELGEGALAWFSGVDRRHELPWSEIAIVALGSMRRRAIRSVHARVAGMDGTVEIIDPEEVDNADQRALDLIARGGQLRLRIIADEFLYACLGARMLGRPHENFPLLARAILARTDAMPNRGAARFQLGHPEWFSYPSWAAFDEESRWLLWKLGETAAGRPRGAEPRASASGRLSAAKRRTPLPGA